MTIEARWTPEREAGRAALRVCLRKMLGPQWRAHLRATAEKRGQFMAHHLAISFTLTNREARRLLRAVTPAEVGR